MSKVIDLATYKAGYRDSIQKAIEDLEQIEEDLFNTSLEILMLGKWQEWSEAQPIGTIFNFREKEMLEADEEIANELLELKHNITEKRIEIMEKYK